MPEEVQRYFEKEVLPKFISDDAVRQMKGMKRTGDQKAAVKMSFGLNVMRDDTKPITGPITITISIDFRNAMDRTKPEKEDYAGISQEVAVAAMELFPQEVKIEVPAEMAKKIFPTTKNMGGALVQSGIERFEFDCVLDVPPGQPVVPPSPPQGNVPEMVPLVPIGGAESK